MSDKLKAVLVLVAITAGGTLIYATREGETATEVLDAGAESGCFHRDMVCQVTREGGGYVLKRFDVIRCVDPADGGASLVLPPGLRARAHELPGLCRPDTEATLQPGGEQEEPFECACSTGADCIQTSDGGAAQIGNTLNPGAWSGAGCHRKPCLEIAGLSSWPAECPQ